MDRFLLAPSASNRSSAMVAELSYSCKVQDKRTETPSPFSNCDDAPPSKLSEDSECSTFRQSLPRQQLGEADLNGSQRDK